MDRSLSSHVCNVLAIPYNECHGCRTYKLDDYFYAVHILYMLGYWLCWKAPQKIVGNKTAVIVVALFCLAVIVAKCYYSFNYYGYADPVTICLASTLFLLFRSFNVNWKFANWITPYCFDIYLVHNVFINFAYKFLKIETEAVVPILNFIGFFLLFTLLSLASTYILMKIPFMKKHIL